MPSDGRLRLTGQPTTGGSAPSTSRRAPPGGPDPPRSRSGVSAKARLSWWRAPTARSTTTKACPGDQRAILDSCHRRDQPCSSAQSTRRTKPAIPKETAAKAATTSVAIHAPRSTAPRTRIGLPNQTIKAARPDTSVCFIHGLVKSRLSGSVGRGSSLYRPRGFRPIGITSAGCSRLERPKRHVMLDRGRHGSIGVPT